MPVSPRPLLVFVCYASEDRAFAKALSEKLGRAGFRCWFDKDSLPAGVEWESNIEKAISSTDATIICLSTRSVSKEGFVQRELKFIKERLAAMPEGSLSVIPIRLDDCTPPAWLSRLQHMDFFRPGVSASRPSSAVRHNFHKLAYVLTERAVDLNKLSHAIQVPATFRFTEKQIREQLNLVLRAPYFGIHTPHRRILEFLVKRAIEEPDTNHPHGLVSLEELARAITKKLGRFDIDRTRTLVNELNSRLSDFYASPNTYRGELIFHVHRERRSRGPKKYHCEINRIETWKARPVAGPSCLRRFWVSLVTRLQENSKDGPPAEVLIIYSNEQPELKERQDHLGRYSGSGEVIAAHLLGRTLTRLGIEHEIARSMSLNRHPGSSDFTVQRNSIRIYLGSSLANRNLKDLREQPEWKLQQHCRFRWYDEENFSGEILYAPPGRKTTSYRYDSYPGEQDHELDYALISVLYDAATNATIIGLGGLSTLGTEQAARFVCEDVYLSDLFNRLDPGKGKRFSSSDARSFEVIREVLIVSNQPTGGEIREVVSHRLPADNHPPAGAQSDRRTPISSETVSVPSIRRARSNG